MAASEGKTYDPGDDFLPARDHGGFVYSEPDLIRVYDRADRLARGWNVKRLSAHLEVA